MSHHDEDYGTLEDRPIMSGRSRVPREAEIAAMREEARRYAQNADYWKAELEAERATCGDWGDSTAPERGCYSETSRCGQTGLLWPADHGCPHWKAR